MIWGINGFEYGLQVLCCAIAFFTFIKLISNDVYLFYHRMLPTIAAIITVHDFYLIVMPFMKNQAAVDMLKLLCDLCAMVTLFMMFFYMSFLRRAKHIKTNIFIGTTIMILLVLVDFVYFRYDLPRPFNTDLVAVIAITLGTIAVILRKNVSTFFDNQDKNIARVMYIAYWVALGGYLIQCLLINSETISAVAFAVDGVIFYIMADRNRIEDTSSILAGKMFDLIEYPVCLVNRDFYMINTNSSATDIFPYAKGVEFAFEDGDFKKKFILGQRMVERQENDKEIYADDKWYRVHWTQVDGKGGIKGYIFTITNITEQHERMQQARSETAEKSQFLAHMSHELRSPLHAIIGVSDILLGKKGISSKNRALIQHIKKASDGLLDLVDAILDFSKLEAGKFTFTDKKYCIDDMLDEIAYSSIINLGSKPVDFVLAVTTDYPKYLFGDALRVREILQNLIGNAVKFTDSGSIRVELAFDVQDEDVHVSFSVEDTGHGMSPDMLNEIFAAYISSGDNDNVEGTGLGLNITKQIVTLLGGDITASSDGIKGSKFVGDFYQKIGGSEFLSERVFNRRTAMQKANYSSENIKPDWIYPQAKILVVDDMRINQEILKQLLEPWKCMVKCVSDGMSAIEECKNNDYQLILMDQMMSPMTGIEASVEIKKYTDAPIVLVTANTEDNAAEIISENKLADFLGKPVHLPEIHRVLDTHISPEFRQREFNENNTSAARRDLQNLVVYQKTLETFVKEMQPLLLHLPSYAREDQELFKVKVHGIKGVSKQIGREMFSDAAEVMEMAAKSEHWNYVERHMDEFLTSLCDVVEDVTAELELLGPDVDSSRKIISDSEKDGEKKEEIINVDEVFANLLDAFEDYDLAKIEAGIELLDSADLNREEAKVFSKIIDAYDELEYEVGSNAIQEYMNK